MSANNNTKVYLALSVLVVVAISILTFLVVKGFDKIKNAPSSLVTQNELSQFYVNYEQSNTIAVVCPNSAKNNPDYAGKCNQGLYGYEGIKKALDTTSREHTVYLRSGVYEFPQYLRIQNSRRYVNLEGEDAKNVILVDKIQGDDTLIEIYGDGGISIRNLTMQGARSDGNTSKGIVSTDNAALTVNQVIFKNFSTAVFAGPFSQSTNIVSSAFFDNLVGVNVSHSDSAIIGNNLFVNNVNGVSLGYPDDYYYGPASQPEDWRRSYEAPRLSSYSTKRVYQNTFYNSKFAIRAVFPGKTRVKNNIFSQNETDYLILHGRSESYEFFDDEIINNGNELLVYNFTDNQLSSIRVYGVPNVGELVSPLVGDTNVYNNLVPFVSTDLEDYNFDLLNFINSGTKLGAVIKFRNKGNPEWVDFDQERSTPGAYGGSCQFYSVGCEYPLSGVKSTIPTTGATSSDQNGDGKVDILDVIEIIKEVFGQ